MPYIYGHERLLWSRRSKFTAILLQLESTRKLAMVHSASKILDLRIPPGNQLDKLKGDRAEQWSIRINEQWRICFEWRDDDAYNVELPITTLEVFYD
jgi:proteic killer suppression protein